VTEDDAAKPSSTIDIIVETPKGSHNKLKFDPDKAAFRLSHVLPVGMTFPFDFGYVPDTVAEDGDPLDVLVLMDAPCPTGCFVQTRLVGVIELEQREKDGTTVRNDRLIGVATDSETHRDVKRLRDVSSVVIDQIEAFFDQYNRVDGKKIRVLRRRGPRAARRLAAEARRDQNGRGGAAG
jgi:inorganic pyrophosphatase